jgi:hypothetical protein
VSQIHRMWRFMQITHKQQDPLSLFCAWLPRPELFIYNWLFVSLSLCFLLTVHWTARLPLVSAGQGINHAGKKWWVGRIAFERLRKLLLHGCVML